jgi:hypothetical protein
MKTDINARSGLESAQAQESSSRFCVLVNSSDQARDVFQIVYANSEAVWRGCDWPRFVGFTTPQRDLYGFEAVAASGAGGWREQLGAQLDQLPPEIEYVMRLEEDFLFLSPVEGDRLDAIAEEMLRADLVYVNLVPVSRGLLGSLVESVRRRLSRKPLRQLSFHEPYYSSLTPAIWKRSYLRDLLRRPGNIWEFEHIVTERRHYAVWQSVLQFDALVSKGKWVPRAGRQLERHGLSLAGSRREFQTRSSRVRNVRERLVFALVGYLSLRLRKRFNLLPNVPKELTSDQLGPVQKGQKQ